ncbi:hypothetical protein [Thiothrix lacustris]|uniref:hypothetical protein n=1 Tax=Thiothrix lacustris TaxID=525917 RepID=UPI0004903784|nr:hypothetical protein [Thiothrix lacustris]
MDSSKPMPEDESSALIGESSTCGIIAATIKQTIVFQKTNTTFKLLQCSIFLIKTVDNHPINWLL